MHQVDLPLWDEVAPVDRGKVAGELRRVLLGDRYVHYVLRRGRRRTIGLTIDHRGLRVGAPPRSTLAEIEAVIRKHAAWVADHLDTWRQRAATLELAVADGVEVPLLGQAVTLRVGSGNNTFEWRTGAVGDPVRASPAGGADELLLRPRAGGSTTGLLERALRTRAHEVFAGRLTYYCQRFGIAPPPLRLTSARTRWGSCSRQSGIRLNWRLIHAPLDLVDYVVAHELAHLREMNHTPRFWLEVERMYPAWREARAALRRFSEQLPSFVAGGRAEEADLSPELPVPAK